LIQVLDAPGKQIRAFQTSTRTSASTSITLRQNQNFALPRGARSPFAIILSWIL
jgi:hypothetical protein